MSGIHLDASTLDDSRSNRILGGETNASPMVLVFVTAVLAIDATKKNDGGRVEDLDDQCGDTASEKRS